MARAWRCRTRARSIASTRQRNDITTRAQNAGWRIDKKGIGAMLAQPSCGVELWACCKRAADVNRGFQWCTTGLTPTVYAATRGSLVAKSVRFWDWVRFAKKHFSRTRVLFLAL